MMFTTLIFSFLLSGSFDTVPATTPSTPPSAERSNSVEASILNPNFGASGTQEGNLLEMDEVVVGIPSASTSTAPSTTTVGPEKPDKVQEKSKEVDLTSIGTHSNRQSYIDIPESVHADEVHPDAQDWAQKDKKRPRSHLEEELHTLRRVLFFLFTAALLLAAALYL